MWNFPQVVGGINVRKALITQCAALFRGWRYRPKEENYVGFSISQAKARRPVHVDKEHWEWLVNYWSDPKQKVITIYVLTFTLFILHHNHVHMFF